MELLKFTGTIKNLGIINESIIPLCLSNDILHKKHIDNIVKIWNDILLKKLFNNTKYGFKLNYIKLILFSLDIIVIIDNNNSLIIIDVHKCKLLLDVTIKNQTLIKLNIKNILINQDKTVSKCDLFSPCISKFNKNKKKICYENIFTIKKFKNNVNIVKINFIKTTSNYMIVLNNHYHHKLLILTEDHKLYSMEIINRGLSCNINDSIITLLSKNIYDYYLFKNVILIRKIIKEDKEKELYFLIDYRDININTFNDIDKSKNKNTIITKNRNNIMKRIHNENIDHYSIIDIENNCNVYNLIINKINTIKNDNTTIKDDNTIITENLSFPNMKISTIKTILNGILISYYSLLHGCFYIRCIFDNSMYNNDFIFVKSEFSNMHQLIINCTYYIIKNDIYLYFILFKRKIITYNISTRKFIIYKNENPTNQITYYDQLKTNEIPTLHKPYLTLNFVIKNKYLNRMLIMLVHYINNKLNMHIPNLCWEIIFNHTKEHDFLNILNPTTKELKREYEDVINSVNKKQKLK